MSPMDNKQSWYEIKAAARGPATIRIYGEIGSHGVSSEMFAQALDNIKNESIELYINSPGGSIDHAKAIYNSLLRHPAYVKGTVDGMAASSASLVLQAADKRVMAQGATLMVHAPWLFVQGNKATLEKAIAYLDTEAAAIADIYASRSGKSAEHWLSVMNEEVWYSGEEAVASGLADEAADNVQARSFAAFNLSNFCNVPDWVVKAATPAPPRAAVVTAEEQILRMKIPAASKRRAIAYLRAHAGVAA